MKIRIQLIIVISALVILSYCSLRILEIPAMILPSWFILMLLTIIVFLVSIGIAFFIKSFFKSDWYLLTFTTVVMAVFSLAYLIFTYKPICKIIVNSNYAGEIKLFVSNSDMNDNEIMVNNYGVGYISKRNFKDGFYPKILKGDEDITKRVKEYSKGSLATTSSDRYSFEYLSFEVPGNFSNAGKSIEDLIKIGAIDTMRLHKK